MKDYIPSHFQWLTWFIGFALVLSMTASYAGNPAFPPIDERLVDMAEQPTRFYVKYTQGAEQQVRELLTSHQLEVVEVLESQRVFVVSGEQEKADSLSNSALVEYVEPEPTRKLYSQ
ncbi:ATPase [Vibrio barjaei]|uniref:ATPase n=1 Tax=Vibrio barjaei TaxID=1676683 RepID=UPI002284BE9A|nr:ATPase [Vibrio barjaei]MCY9871313.1 ATPase [Vibrio barjaei]